GAVAYHKLEICFAQLGGARNFTRSGRACIRLSFENADSRCRGVVDIAGHRDGSALCECHPEARLMEWLAFLMFAAVILVLLAGYAVAFTLGGVALLIAAIGTVAGIFEPALLSTVPSRVYGIMSNETLVAVPLFVFMGVVLERARTAEDALETMA